MQKNFIVSYAKNMSMDDIDNFVKKNNIDITEQDKKTIFDHIKKYCDVFFDDPIKYIKMLKGDIDDKIYYNLLMLYDKYKNLL